MFKSHRNIGTSSSLIASIANSFGLKGAHGNQQVVSYLSCSDIAALTAGLVEQTEGASCGWPSNDVPLVVMYSTNMSMLTQMRRLVQASGVRFLGYDRTQTLMDALSVLTPVAVIVEEQDSAAAYRLGRQIMAYDYSHTLIRLVGEAAVTEVKGRRKAVGAAGGDHDGVDGPFVARLPVDLTPHHLIATFGRLNVLPRRLFSVR